MPTFILTLSWTDQGIRAVKDAPKRSQAAKELPKKLGVEVKQVYLTSGEHDLLLIVESSSGVSSGANIDKNHRFKIRQGGTHSSRPSNLAAVLGPIKAEP
jgi:uncharacterized protein with GYD domain